MEGLVFIDLETTGFSTVFNEIIEIAAITEIDGKEVTFHEYIKPKTPITSKITELTGITNEMVAFSSSEKEVLTNLFDWLISVQAQKLVAHNAPFEKRFLADRSKKFYVTDNFYDQEFVDTLKISRKLIKEEKLKTADGKATLSSVGQALGVNFVAHSAINDTRALKEIYYKLEGGDNV